MLDVRIQARGGCSVDCGKNGLDPGSPRDEGGTRMKTVITTKGTKRGVAMDDGTLSLAGRGEWNEQADAAKLTQRWQA